MSDVASLRLRAFSTKLTLKRLRGFYQQLASAKLLESLPDSHEIVAAPELQHSLSEFADVHRRMESLLFEQVARLTVEAEEAANRYCVARYGFGPGDMVKVEPRASSGPVRLRVSKVFLQSTAESDIRIEAASIRPDGIPLDTWDLFFSGPGQLQFARSRRRTAATG